MCTLLLKDTIQYYVDRQSSVNTCFVDATKAFDMVKFDKLFLLMIKRGVSSIDLRAMMDLYSHQRIRTGMGAGLDHTSMGPWDMRTTCPFCVLQQKDCNAC